MSTKTAKVGPFEVEVSDDHIYLSPNLGIYYDYVPWNIIGEVIEEAGLKQAELIDVGANVGDTLAHFRRISNAHAICVEPAQQFFSVLERNAAQFGDVTLLNKLLAPDHLVGRVAYSSGDQTGQSQAATMGGNAWGGNYVTFGEIFENRRGPFILKSDTDGFDAEIVGAALPYIARREVDIPVIFFEGPTGNQILTNTYDAYLDVCRELQRNNYNLLILANSGMPYVYVGRSSEALVSAFKALEIGYQRGAALCHYYDVIAVDGRLAATAIKLTTAWPDHVFRRT